MSLININNYERYVLDYLEGNLNPEMTAIMEQFLQDNPAINIEVENLFTYTVVKDDSVIYPDKESLKKGAIIPFKMIVGIAASFLALILITGYFMQENKPAKRFAGENPESVDSPTQNPQAENFHADNILKTDVAVTHSTSDSDNGMLQVQQMKKHPLPDDNMKVASPSGMTEKNRPVENKTYIQAVAQMPDEIPINSGTHTHNNGKIKEFTSPLKSGTQEKAHVAVASLKSIEVNQVNRHENDILKIKAPIIKPDFHNEKDIVQDVQNSKLMQNEKSSRIEEVLPFENVNLVDKIDSLQKAVNPYLEFAKANGLISETYGDKPISLKSIAQALIPESLMDKF